MHRHTPQPLYLFAHTTWAAKEIESLKCMLPSSGYSDKSEHEIKPSLSFEHESFARQFHRWAHSARSD